MQNPYYTKKEKSKILINLIESNFLTRKIYTDNQLILTTLISNIKACCKQP